MARAKKSSENSTDGIFSTSKQLCQTGIGPNGHWTKWALDQVGIGPNGYWTKWVLDQMSIGPKWALGQMDLDQLGLDEMGI